MPPTPPDSPALTIVSSDQPATLVERLAHDLGATPLGPFASETIVVGSRGTERWVRHELARRHGCAAGLDFPFAASFFRTLSTGLPDDQGVTPGASTRRTDDELQRRTWRILDLLEQGIAAEAGFEPLRAFCGTAAEHDGRKLLGLARVLAERFEEYQLYRPELLSEWARGNCAPVGPAAWQGALWQRLQSSDVNATSPARLYLDALERLTSATHAPRGLPHRLSVIGVNTMPPIFVRLLHAVARHVPVRVYLQAPPRHTWSDAGTNPLFATFGGVVRDFVTLLEGQATTGRAAWEEHHAPDVAREATMLAHLQADIRTGTHRDRASAIEVDVARDASLRVHRCHSPMREMEVLRDQLFAAFAADSSLRPHDVMLLVPDVATYAPMVDAVFGVGEAGLPRISYRIADRPLAQESRVTEAALRMLRLVGARWTATEIVELLDLPPVRRAAGLDGDAMRKVIGWIEQTTIRWGRDGAMRRDQFALPAIEANSWRAGIDRLLMGYATGRVDEAVGETYPVAGDTIGDPETLGHFAQFADTLFDALTKWREAHTLAEWTRTFSSVFSALISPDDEEEERQLGELLSAVEALAVLEMGAGVDRTVELGVVRDWLEQRLGDAGRSAGFLSGSMTVCALSPMRVVPQRVVAIAGLDDASFPRRHDRPAFDLLAAPSGGDRNRRADDRQLFLDTLLAAGERLIITYVARSARNNTERAASVVVAELLDVVDDGFTARDTGCRARQGVEVEHLLQPFSPAYFTGDAGNPLFSYSRVSAQALECAASGTRTPASPFITADIVAEHAPSAPLEIRLEDLIACWTNPARFFCTRTLGVRLPREGGALGECEPLTVDSLDRYKLHDAMLARHLRGPRDIDLERAEASALGQLPSGALAPVWFDALNVELQSLLERVGQPAFQPPCAVDARGDGWSIRGTVNDVTLDGVLHVRPGDCRPQDRVRAWITHLAVSATFGAPLVTRLVGTSETLTFSAVDAPYDVLDALVAGYRATLARPIPVFPRASHDYVKQELQWEEKRRTGRGSVTKSSIDTARTAFRERAYDQGPRGDVEDGYIALCWRGREPLEDARDDFVRWSALLWTPAFASLAANGGAA